MSKFRARQLDATKPIPVYLQEDISDYTDVSNVTNRTVPQMPTGMEKEEETEHHLQQAIFHQRVIPVPEVYDVSSEASYLDNIYPATYKAPRQLIHIHPFSAEQDILDYDMDSEDEVWLNQQSAKGELLPLHPIQFEEMMDRLEKSSGLKAITLHEAKVLLKDDDDLITAVYDYWLNKRLRVQHPLIPQAKTEKGVGTAPSDPYVAFRKRTEKMQTRKNRKNDETSYEKMLKLRRDLARAVTLLQMVNRREKAKRELLHLNIEVYEKRYELQDYSGALLSEMSTLRAQQRPAFAPLVSNHQLSPIPNPPMGALTHHGWIKLQHQSATTVSRKREDGKRERKYKKRRRHHGSSSHHRTTSSPAYPQHQPLVYNHPPDPYTLAGPHYQDSLGNLVDESSMSSGYVQSEEEAHPDGYYTFTRKKYCQYHAPREGDVQWVPPNEGGDGDPCHQYSLTTLANANSRYIGLARRRVGRGGRIWFDRVGSPLDSLLNKGHHKEAGANGLTSSTDLLHQLKTEWPHFCPRSSSDEQDTDVEVDVESISYVPSTTDLPVMREQGGVEGISDNMYLSSSTTTTSIRDASNHTAGLPATVLITAETLEGSSKGAYTDLEVTVPSDLDALLQSSSTDLLLTDDDLEIDLLDTPASTADLASDVLELNSNQLSSGCQTKHSGSSVSLLDGLVDRDSGETSSRFNRISSSTRSRYVQHSRTFSSQPTSKFITLDSTSSLTSPGSDLQLSTGSTTGSLGIHVTTVASSHSFSSTLTNSVTSSVFSSCSPTSLPNASASLSNKCMSTVSSCYPTPSLKVVSDKSISENFRSERSSGANTPSSDNKLTALLSLPQQSQNQKKMCSNDIFASNVFLTNNKSTESGLFSSTTTNSIFSQKYFSTTRPPTDGTETITTTTAAVVANGPANSV